MAARSKIEKLEDMLEQVERLAGIRGGMHIRKQNPDGSWPKLPPGLSEDCLIVELASFGHDRVARSSGPYGPSRDAQQLQPDCNYRAVENHRKAIKQAVSDANSP